MDPDKTPETHVEEDTEEDTEEDIPDTGMDRVRVSVTIGNIKKARFSAPGNLTVYSVAGSMLPKDYGFKLKRTGQVVKPMDTLHDMKVALNALAMMIPVLDMATGTWTNFKVYRDKTEMAAIMGHLAEDGSVVLTVNGDSSRPVNASDTAEGLGLMEGDWLQCARMS